MSLPDKGFKWLLLKQELARVIAWFCPTRDGQRWTERDVQAHTWNPGVFTSLLILLAIDRRCDWLKYDLKYCTGGQEKKHIIKSAIFFGAAVEYICSNTGLVYRTELDKNNWEMEQLDWCLCLFKWQNDPRFCDTLLGGFDWSLNWVGHLFLSLIGRMGLTGFNFRSTHYSSIQTIAGI